MKQPFEALFSAEPRFTREEFDQLFLECYPKIQATAFRLTGDPDEADDLAGETFWKLWQHPPRSKQNLAGWLYRVVTHLGYNRLRASRRRVENEQKYHRLETAGTSGSGLEDQVLVNQEREAVWATLKAMPRRDVQILILRAGGLSYQEIAQSLGISSGSVGTLISRAEKKFNRLHSQGEKHALER